MTITSIWFKSKTCELWHFGGIMTVTEPKDIESVSRAVKTAKGLGVNVNDYVSYLYNNGELF